MASTKISAEKTASEVQNLIGKYGAKHVMTSYDNKEIVGLSFIIVHGNKQIPFMLPVRWQSVLEAMKKDKHTPNHLCSPEQAKRVAWRQVLRWVQAQMALIEVGMVDIKEVFMPYMLMNIKTGETLFDRLIESKFKLIEFEEEK